MLAQRIQKSWYENGMLRTINQLDTNMQFNGTAKTWSSDGKIKYEGQYKNDEPYGIWKYYNASGKLEKEEDRTKPTDK